ncbi:MAG: hypothetical protein Q4G58_16525 [bacterium]|nr:hypothetical protein [bacterium]
MANITNIAKVDQYTYNVGSTTKTIATPIFSQVSNKFTDPQISFTKVCTPAFSDLNETVTITYRVENIDNATGSPVISTIQIVDPFLTESIPFIDIAIGSNIIKYNQTTGTFEILLSDGSLTPGNSVEATFSYVVSPGFDFTQNLTTTATASFNLSPSGTLPARFSSCGSMIQNGTLDIVKTATPTTAVSSGSVISYIITITNIGNVPSTIPVGLFVDPIPAGTEYIANTISPVGHLVYDSTSNSITNANPLTITNNSAPYTINFSVRVL